MSNDPYFYEVAAHEEAGKLNLSVEDYIAAIQATGGNKAAVAELVKLRAAALAKTIHARENGSTANTDEDILARLSAGGGAILDLPSEDRALWGYGDRILWADGEALIIAGGQGAGKTTIAQQLALGLCGVPGFDTLLGLPVIPTKGKVLYLAMDRPKQAIRSMQRMITAEHRDILDAKMVVWQGPPPADFAQDTNMLTKLCQMSGADHVFVDSLKDAVIGLVDDVAGASYNRARQAALAAGVQVVELHHNRKASRDSKSDGPHIDDIYGSTWITSGAGSVILLQGEPGDPIVKMTQVKQPSEPVGPWRLKHDPLAGRTVVYGDVDLVELAGSKEDGISATEAASALFDKAKPTSADKEKARRRLDSLAAKGLLVIADYGDKTQGRPARYRPATSTRAA